MNGAAAVNEPLFESAHAALTFAFLPTNGYERPLMSRLAAAASMGRATGHGLIRFEAAAQRGMIRADVHRLGPLFEAAVIARFAQQRLHCGCRAPCCQGHRPNPEWQQAIALLAERARSGPFADCGASAPMRQAYVQRYFTPRERRASLEALAQRFDIDRHTASAHYARVDRWLRGDRRAGGVPPDGLETEVLAAIEQTLRGKGVVG